jgi:hypothetical protein
MPRTKKKMRITLPDGVTARDVKRALAALRNAGIALGAKSPLDMAHTIALEREAAVLLKLAEENPPDPSSAVLT